MVQRQKNVKTRTILKEGHPSQTIVNVAKEEGFDIIVIGSRGLGDLKKFFLSYKGVRSSHLTFH